MYIEGTTIHNEGVSINLENELRIRQISQTIRALSQTAEINMKLVKCDKTHEVLLWGAVSHLPLGIFSRGSTLGQALDITVKKVANYCAKARALRAVRRPHPAAAQAGKQPRLAMVA